MRMSAGDTRSQQENINLSAAKNVSAFRNSDNIGCTESALHSARAGSVLGIQQLRETTRRILRTNATTGLLAPRSLDT